MHVILVPTQLIQDGWQVWHKFGESTEIYWFIGQLAAQV